MATDAQTVIAGVELVADAAAPLLPPNMQLALAIAKAAIMAIERAQNNGRDVTEAELDALFEEDEKARQADLAAQAAMKPKSS